MGFLDLFRSKPKPADFFLRQTIDTAVQYYLPPEAGKVLRRIQYDTLEFHRLLAIFGKAFGPKDCTHWSELPYDTQVKLLEVCPILKEDHDDWVILKNVDRTASLWLAAELPPILVGNIEYEQPIPDRGEWFARDGYLAFQTESGLHGRLGWRLDDVETAKWNASGGLGYLFFLSVALKPLTE